MQESWSWDHGKVPIQYFSVSIHKTRGSEWSNRAYKRVSRESLCFFFFFCICLKRDVAHEEVFNLLKDDPQYPPEADKNRRRTIRKTAENYILEHGVLFRVSGEVRQQWVSTPETQREILSSCHASNVGGAKFPKGTLKSDYCTVIIVRLKEETNKSLIKCVQDM